MKNKIQKGKINMPNRKTINTSPHSSPERKRSFTLIELLVVIAIIAILAGMLLPALQNARERSRTVSCLSNVKQLSSAILNYADTYAEWLPAGYNGSGGEYPWASIIYSMTARKVNSARYSLGSFAPSGSFFTCPSEKTPVGSSSKYYFAHGHYSLNAFLCAPEMNPTTSGSNQFVRRKLAQVRQPSIALLVFDGSSKTLPYFTYVSSTSYKAGEKIASRHGAGVGGYETNADHFYVKGASMNGGFVDGHAEVIPRNAWWNGTQYNHKLIRNGYENNYQD